MKRFAFIAAVVLLGGCSLYRTLSWSPTYPTSDRPAYYQPIITAFPDPPPAHPTIQHPTIQWVDLAAGQVDGKPLPSGEFLSADGRWYIKPVNEVYFTGWCLIDLSGKQTGIGCGTVNEMKAHAEKLTP